MIRKTVKRFNTGETAKSFFGSITLYRDRTIIWFLFIPVYIKNEYEWA